jgi:hypothetical protein
LLLFEAAKTLPTLPLFEAAKTLPTLPLLEADKSTTLPLLEADKSSSENLALLFEAESAWTRVASQ